MGRKRVEEISDMIRCEDGESVYYVRRDLFTRVVMGEMPLERKYVRYDTGAALYDMGLSSFMILARDAKARVKLNRMILVDVKKIDAYLSYFSES